MSITQRLSAGVNYTLHVTEISGPKQFSRGAYPGIKFYSFKIYFLDKSGKQYMGEYVQTGNTEQNKFHVGQEAEFHVCNTSGNVDEVCPGHLSLTEKPNPQIAATGSVQHQPVLQASGQTYTFAMGYAKDVYCEQVKLGQIQGDADSIENIERLVSMAKQINSGLIEMQREQIIKVY